MSAVQKIDVDVARAFTPLYEPHRYKVYYGGRGAAKSWAFARALIAMGVQRPLRILCTRELQKSIADSVHQLLDDQIRAMGLEWAYEVLKTEIRSRINDTYFIFGGIKHSVTEIKSTEGIDIVWVEEAEAVTAASWRILIPTIRKEGSEIWVSFNPRNPEDATFTRFVTNADNLHDAVVRKVSWRDNPWFPDVLRREMEADKRADYNTYLHVWEGEFLQYDEHAYYAKQLRVAYDEGRIVENMPVDKSVPVNTFWDLGKRDAAACWFHQEVGLQHRFLSYREATGAEVSDLAGWCHATGYTFGAHYFPHDVEQDRLGMEMTVKDQLESLGISPIIVVPRVRAIDEGIQQTRREFPKAWFDKEGCARGLECLGHYAPKFDDERNVNSAQPNHNWASHGADAFRQWAQGYRVQLDDWQSDLPLHGAGNGIARDSDWDFDNSRAWAE